MKRLLVIGAGLAQADAIGRARQLGYHVIATDGDPLAPGLALADEAHVLDVKDAAAHVKLARGLSIDGVISFSSDICLPTVQEVRTQLRLPGLGLSPMRISMDKGAQRLCFAKAGVAQPRFFVVEGKEAAARAAEELGYPLIVKPMDNAGSRGVSLVEQQAVLHSAVDEAYRHTGKPHVLLEEFVVGLELTVEGITLDGVHHVLTISQKFKPEGQPCVATQLAYPADISAGQRESVVRLVRAAYDAAGLDNTPTHTEVILTPSGPTIVEIGCRGGGFFVFTRVVQAASGYDVVGNWIRFCASDPIEPVRTSPRGVVLRFMIGSPGLLQRVEGLEDARNMPGVRVGVFVQPGEVIPEFRNDGSRTGWMIVEAETLETALEKADRVSQLVRFVVG